jgi:hypothetical protein
MFAVARSVFWLTLAYLVIKPGADLPDTAELSAQAMAAGSQMIAQQIEAIECQSWKCMGGKAVIAAALPATAPVAARVDANPIPVPLPRPRPDQLG